MSISINVDLSGTTSFSEALNSFDSAIKTRVQQRLVDWATSVKAEAEKMVPVRTGYMQSTIFVAVQEWQLVIGAKAEYAAAIEFGTTHSKAKPYLTPALEAQKPALEQTLLDALEQAKSEVQP
jgi:HK97 gp10 family phage protein